MMCWLFAVQAVAQTSPEIPLPQVWLRADQGMVSSSVWSDVSGHQRNATGHGPAGMDTLNYNPSLLFDGIDDALQIPYSLEGLSELTIIAVFQSADTTERGVLGAENFLSRKVKLTTARVTGPDSAVTSYGNHGQQAVIGALVQNWNDASSLSEDAYILLGGTGSGLETKPFKGSIAEVLVYNTALTFMERQQVKTYLAIKYGIALTDGNYLSAGGEVLWHAEQNEGFGHRITGLGRDDAFSLYQKQAKSAQDTSNLLLLSAGQLAVTNAANKSSMPDGNFLVWGDNDLPLIDKKGEGQDSLLSILQRKWIMSATGGSASQLPTELRLDTKQLPPDSLGYWLVIDGSGQGNFAADQLEYVLPDSISKAGIAYFHKLRWDKDRSGKDQFSFARAKSLLAVASNVYDPDCEDPNSGSTMLRVIGGDGPYQYSCFSSEAAFEKQWEAKDSTALTQLAAGNYTFGVTDAAGKQASWTFSLRLPNTLIVDLGEDLELMEGETLMLDAGQYIPDSIPATYLWENNFGFKSTEREIALRETGIYTVTVTNAEGCTFQDKLEVSGGTEQRYAVFPSLVRSGRTVNVSISLREEGPVRVNIRSLNGNRVQQMQGSGSSEYHFTGTFQQAGMYLVVLESPEGTKTKRVVVY